MTFIVNITSTDELLAKIEHLETFIMSQSATYRGITPFVLPSNGSLLDRHYTVKCDKIIVSTVNIYYGVLNGVVTIKNTKGELIARLYYDNGRLHGDQYIRSGHAEHQQWHLGERHGEWIIRYPNGNLKKVIHYVNGSGCGQYLKWHKNGQLYYHAELVKGIFTGTHTHWNREGVLIHDITY